MGCAWDAHSRGLGGITSAAAVHQKLCVPARSDFPEGKRGWTSMTFFFLETWPWKQSQGRIYSSLTLSLTSAKELLYLHSPPCYLEQVWIFRWFLFLLFSFRPSFISILFMDTWDISPDGSLSLSFLFSRYLLLKHTLWKASSSSREQPFYSSSHCNIWFGTTEFTPSC